MFATADPGGYQPVAPGIRRKTLCHGDATLISEFRLDAGQVLPMHAHPQEQTGYLVAATGAAQRHHRNAIQIAIRHVELLLVRR